jgi:uncharacterized protein (TIGR02147 family)
VLNNSQAPYYQTKLREEFAKRIAKNSRYSLRAFATLLGIGPSALSHILSGKRAISTKLINRIFSALELGISERKKFLESVLQQKEAMGMKRISPGLKKKLKFAATPAPGVIEIGNDDFRILSNWYHFAILELTTSKNFESSPTWIAKVLRISELEASLAIEHLIKLGILHWVGGSLQKTRRIFDTKDKTKTSSFHRNRQKQILEKSIQSLEQDPIETRNHSSITLCINPDRLVEAKEKIQKIMWELTEFLIEGEQRQVYELNLSLFPLSKSS